MKWYLMQGTTLELAKHYGATWLRDLPNGGKEMFHLPPGYFKDKTTIMTPELAYAQFCIMQNQQEQEI